MIQILSGLLIIACAILGIPVLVLLLQSLLAFKRLGVAPAISSARPRIAILVPAHNEELGISKTVLNVRAQLQGGDRILVVADNCSDGTAQAARGAGAEVVERFNTDQRGKGFALDFGVRHLATDAPEAVIIVDADCLVATGAIDRLARLVWATGRPVQALYLMRSPKGSGPMKKIAEFAWVVKNLVRPLGYYRVGLPCQLMGTGMAFTWDTISNAALATGHIVEDMKLGMDLAISGVPPLFCPHAEVYSEFPSNEVGAKSQRTRWEHGHISMILSEAPRLFGEAFRRGKVSILALALDLSVPPVALLTLMVLGLFFVSAALGLLSNAVLPVLVATSILVMLAIAVLLSWWRYGRQILSAPALAMAVLYVFWKIPLYFKFMVSRQVEWVRSKRDTEGD